MFSQTSLDPRVTVLVSIRTAFGSYSNSATTSFQHNDYSSISAIDPLQSYRERPPKLEPNIVLYVALSVQYSIYVLRNVGIGTILELSCAKWEFSLCCAIPE